MKKCAIVIPEWRIIKGWFPAYAEAFEALGYQVDAIDTIDDLLRLLSSSITEDTVEDYEFFLTFSGYAIFEAAKNGLSLERLRIPIISLYVDHPENTPARFNLSPPHSFSGLFDRGDMEYVHKHLKSPTQYFFLTDAGLEYPGPLPGFDERDIDILFCGTIPDHNGARDNIKNLRRPNLLRLFDDFTNMLMENDRLSPLDAYELLSQDAGFCIKSGKLDESVIHAMFSLGTHYVRAKRRLRLINTLLDSGLKIYLVGDSQYVHLFNSPNLEVLDNENNDTFGDRYLQLVRRAKVTINTSPLSQYALSERQPTSMLNGAVTVTDMNPYMDIYFEDGRDLIAYSHSDYSPLPARIRQVLDNRVMWENIQRNAYATAKTHHTFLNRAKDILNVLHSGF